MSLTRAQLLGAERKRVSVQIPELGGAVTIQAPTAGGWLEYQRWLNGLDADSLDHATRIVALTAIDEEGKTILSEEDCRELPHDMLLRLARAAFDLTKVATVENAKGES